jgi:uncharacterized protein
MLMNEMHEPGKDYSNHVFQGLRDMAELPYFELSGDSRLRLAMDDLNAGIDGHVHFALNALSGPRPDLLARHPETNYYLDQRTPLAMNKYMGLNQTESDIALMTASMLGMLSPQGSEMTVTHTIPNLLAEMDSMKIERAVVLPIAYGFPYGDDVTEWYLDAIERSGSGDRFIICGGIKPTHPDAIEKTRRYKLKGLRGIKLHPNIALFTPDDRRAWAFYEECAHLELPVLIHCGLVGKDNIDPGESKGYTGRHADIVHFQEPIKDFPGLRFVLCHSGALQNDQAIALAKAHKNVWLDIQGQGVDRIRKMIAEVGPERLMFGSDWPFFPVASLLARLLVATEGDKAVRSMIFRDNARRFWGLD